MVQRDLTSGFATELGLDIRAPGDVRLRIEPRHLNGVGTLMGPVVFTMVDYAMAGIAWEAVGEGETTATVSISLNFLDGAATGDLRCRAALERRGRTILALKAEVRHEDGRLLATSIGTFAIRRKRAAKS